MPEIHIRTFIFPDDYQPVHLFWEQAGAGIHVGHSDESAEIQKKLEHDSDLFLIAERNGELAGTVIGGFDGRRGLIYHLTVRNDLRKHGLGNILMDEVEKRLLAKGCTKCYLLVATDNYGAMHFYEKRGWSEMKNIRLYGKDLE